MTEAKDLINQIAARYGVRDGPADPITMVYSILEESRKLLSVFQGASTSLFSREMALATQALELTALVRQVKTIQRLYRVRIATSLMSGLASGRVIGTIVGFFLR